MMVISEVAKLSGLPASTLRYYEEKGLIASVGRRGLSRLFDQDIFERLSLIALARFSGFSLDEIGTMMSPEVSQHIKREKLTEKAEELDQKIHKLTVMRDGLRHAAKCKAPSHMECPKFQRLIRLAGKMQSKNKNLSV